MHYTDDSALPEVREEEFLAVRQAAMPYTVMILRAGPNFRMPGPDGDPAVTEVIMRHGKRNLALRLAGLMPIICPIGDGSGVTGIGVFDASPDEVERIMAADPGVTAGVFTYEVHPCRSFPGSALPGGTADNGVHG
jgi:hypothetical protein